MKLTLKRADGDVWLTELDENGVGWDLFFDGLENVWRFIHGLPGGPILVEYTLPGREWNMGGRNVMRKQSGDAKYPNELPVWVKQ